MSGVVNIKITQDTVTPAVRRLLKLGKDTTPVMRAMGTTFKSITEGTFNSAGASYRAKPWPAKKDGSPSNLQKSTTMAKSFQLSVSKDRAVVSNPMPYAAIHQFGGVIEPKNAKALSWVGPDGKRYFAMRVVMPARPFFPVEANGEMTAKASEKVVAAGMRAVERLKG